MIGAPFDSGDWSTVTDTYYAGAGGGEFIWLMISIALCVVALIGGAIHEGRAYKRAERDNPDLRKK